MDCGEGEDGEKGAEIHGGVNWFGSGESSFGSGEVASAFVAAIQAYQNLYESALSYGMRKALQGENKHAEYNSKINDLTSETTALEKEVKGIEDTIKKLNKDDEDEQVRNKKDHEDEIAKIKNKIKTFRETLEAKLSGEEKKKKQEAERS